MQKTCVSYLDFKYDGLWQTNWNVRDQELVKNLLYGQFHVRFKVSWNYKLWNSISFNMVTPFKLNIYKKYVSRKCNSQIVMSIECLDGYGMK